MWKQSNRLPRCFICKGLWWGEYDGFGEMLGMKWGQAGWTWTTEKLMGNTWAKAPDGNPAISNNQMQKPAFPLCTWILPSKRRRTRVSSRNSRFRFFPDFTSLWKKQKCQNWCKSCDVKKIWILWWWRAFCTSISSIATDRSIELPRLVD